MKTQYTIKIAQTESQQALCGIDQNRQAGGVPGRARPLAQAAAMLGAQGRLRRVRADSRQAQERVQIETCQPAGVAAHAQIPFYQCRLARKRQNQHQPYHGQKQGRARRIQPDHGGGGGDHLADRAHELTALPRQKAQPVQKMRPLGHVGDGPALKIAIPKQGQLAQKSLAQAHLQPAAGAPHGTGQGPFDEEERGQKHQQRTRRRQALLEKRQALANLHGAAEKQRLSHGPDPGQRQPGQDGQEAQNSVGT
jgi:hypothetical protein